MSPATAFATAAAFAATLAGLAAPAVADDSQLFGVTAIDVRLSGATPALTVRNVAANHNLDSLQLAVQGSKVSVAVSGYVDCTGIQVENWANREGHFLSGGAFGIGRTSLLMGEDLPNSSDIDHVSDMDARTFQLPVTTLANPQIGIDPLAVVLAAADKAPNRLAWLRQNHTLTVKIPLRWEAACAKYIRNKITKKTIVESAQPSYLTKDVSLQIKYQGDPQLFAVNAQLSQGGGLPGQLQAGAQPFKVTSLSFQPNMPHHIGACPATTKIRVFYQAQGKGEIRIRVNDGSSTIYDSAKIAVDSKNGKQHHDFEIATPKASKSDLNKTVAHPLKVYVRGKGESEQVWPAQFHFKDSATWNHRCTPQVNPVLGGGKPAFQQKQPAPRSATPVIKRAQ